MRRYAQAGTRKDLLTCSQLLKLSPSDEYGKQLMRGFEEAFQGRRVANLPDELVVAMSRLGGQSVVLGLRQGKPEAVAQALKTIANEKADASERLQYVQILGEVKQPSAVPVLLQLINNSSDEGLKMAALTALQIYDAPQVAQTVLAAYPAFTDDVRSVAQTLLVSRKSWALELLAAIDAGKISPKSVPLDVARQLTVHRDQRIAAGVKKHWGQLDGATTAEMQQQIARLTAVVEQARPRPTLARKCS